MPAGVYLARCVHAEIKRRGHQTLLILTFVVEGPPFEGVVLRHWLKVSDCLLAHSKPVRAYAIAANRELRADEELSLKTFLEKLFTVRVGYRMNDSKNRFDVENSKMKKDEKDFIRVHEILSLYDDKAAGVDLINERESLERVRAVKVVPARRKGRGEQ